MGYSAQCPHEGAQHVRLQAVPTENRAANNSVLPGQFLNGVPWALGGGTRPDAGPYRYHRGRVIGIHDFPVGNHG
jgi:hypothetical protein